MNCIVPVVAVVTLAIPLLTNPSVSAANPIVADCLVAKERAVALHKNRRLREARTDFLLCATARCPANIREPCARRVEEVDAAIPTVVFEAKDAAGANLFDVGVTVDGQPLANHLDGIAVSIDPGEHLVEFEMPGAPPVMKRFVIHDGEKNRRERVVFATIASAGGRLVLGGEGLARLGIAAFGQGTTLHRRNSSLAAAQRLAPEVQPTSPTSAPLRRQAEQPQTHSIFSESMGTVVLAAGVYLVLSSPSRSRPREAWEASVQVGSTMGVTLSRAF